MILQESENRYLLGEVTAASQVLKDVVSRVEKDIREGKTMRSRHGILLEAVRETKWKMIILEDKLK